jgi:hypothetical protein
MLFAVGRQDLKGDAMARLKDKHDLHKNYTFEELILLRKSSAMKHLMAKLFILLPPFTVKRKFKN